jgi:DNA-binding MarR family transcriptional regulator
MASSMDDLNALRATAERLAAAARDPRRLDEVRRAAQRALAGIDPESVDRAAADYRAGQAELVLAVVTALGERSLSRATSEMLLKANRARVLDAVSHHPGLNQRQLAAELELAPSNLNDYLGELREHGLIEQTAARDGRGVAFQVTPWGRQAISHLAVHHPEATAPRPAALDAAAAAGRTAARVRPRSLPRGPRRPGR